jgi:hypothetical protein
VTQDHHKKILIRIIHQTKRNHLVIIHKNYSDVFEFFISEKQGRRPSMHKPAPIASSPINIVIVREIFLFSSF